MRLFRSEAGAAMQAVAERLAGLAADEVDRCCVIRYGSALSADDGAFVAFLLPSDVLLWPEAAPSITTTINDHLFDDLLRASKLFQLQLDATSAVPKTLPLSALFSRKAAPFACTHADFASMVAGLKTATPIKSREEIADVV